MPFSSLHFYLEKITHFGNFTNFKSLDSDISDNSDISNNSDISDNSDKCILQNLENYPKI